MSDTVSVDQLADAINAALQEYATLAAEDMKKCIDGIRKLINGYSVAHVSVPPFTLASLHRTLMVLRW